MKKMISLLLVVVMAFGIFAACTPTQTNNPTNPSTGVNTPPEDSERALRMTWKQASGTDIGRIESPYRDVQSYLPWMLWDKLGESSGLEINKYLLAESITHNADYTVFTIKLADRKWQDGQPIDGEDVIWTIKNIIKNPNSSQSVLYQYVKGFDAFKADETTELEGVALNADGTVSVTLTQTVGDFHITLANIRPLPEHLLGKCSWANVDTNDYWVKPIGSGAYKMNEVAYPDYVTVTRWDDYYGEKAGIKNVKFVSFGSGGAVAVTTALATGAIDFADGMSLTGASDHVVAAKNNSNLKIMNEAAYTVRMFAYNLNCRADGQNKTALQNNKVRRALAMMFDSEGLVELAGGGMLTTELLLPATDSAYDSKIKFDKKLDSATAKAWLTEGGWNFNDTLDIAYYYDDEFTRSMMTYITQCLAEVGVKANCYLLSGDLAALLYQSCNYDLVFLQGACTAANPANIYMQMTASRSYTFMAKGELSDAMDAKYAPVFGEYLAALDWNKKVEKAQQLMAMNYEDCYIFPVYINGKAETYNKSVVQLPEECFAQFWDGAKNWSEWKMLVD